MKEQSQIEDMRAAVRGDIERAKQRRSSPALQMERDPVAAPEPDRVPEEEPRRQSGLFAFFRKR
jgi:hypothetical protein